MIGCCLTVGSKEAVADVLIPVSMCTCTDKHETNSCRLLSPLKPQSVEGNKCIMYL